MLRMRMGPNHDFVRRDDVDASEPAVYVGETGLFVDQTITRMRPLSLRRRQ